MLKNLLCIILTLIFVLVMMPLQVYLDTAEDIKKFLLKNKFVEKVNEGRKNHVCLTNGEYDFYLPLFYVGYFIIYRVKDDQIVDYFLNHSLQPKIILKRFKAYLRKTEKNEAHFQKE